MKKPTVALVGRPNVGKSTLFNRLVGERLAVTDDIPGTTRDRISAESDWNGISFEVIDTGGIDPITVSSGSHREPLSLGSAKFINEIRFQAEIAIQEADVILFITDAESGITSADEEVAKILRRSQKKIGDQLFPPIILVVNKADNMARREQAVQFYELGMGEPYPVSALHGTSTGDLLDAVVVNFPQQDEQIENEGIRVAIVGKQNAGKSSLLNKILGEERAIVSPIPGTTRDAIDTHIVFVNIPITLIDTAGIRRRGRVTPGVEKFSVFRSMRAIERSDVVLLVIDAVSGITAQDTHIAGYILDAWKSAIVIVNKWDAIEKDSYTMEAYSKKIREELNFMDFVPVLFISALTGQRVNKVLPLTLQVHEERLVRLPTSKFNAILRAAQEKHPAPSHAGRHLRIYYGTQVRNDPPTFLLHVNDPKLSHFSYERFLENRLREEYPFLGTPIRFVMRSHRKE